MGLLIFFFFSGFWFLLLGEIQVRSNGEILSQVVSSQVSIYTHIDFYVC